MAAAPLRWRALDRLIAPSAAPVLTVTVVLLAADRLYPRIGDNLLGGVCDETAHLLTGVLVLMALPRRRAPGERTRTLAVGLLAGSVLIDLDHIPRLLGTDWLTHGTPRPYTHSLLSLCALALLSVLWRGHRWLLVGAFVGLAVHFTRDLAESPPGVSLLWPWTKASQSVPHWSYLIAVGGLTLIAGIHAGRWSRAQEESGMPFWTWLEARKRRLAR